MDYFLVYVYLNKFELVMDYDDKILCLEFVLLFGLIYLNVCVLFNLLVLDFLSLLKVVVYLKK